MSEFVEIDGSFGEGGGQILRTSVSLSCALDRPVRITNIRSRRANPGLRPQHLKAVTSAAEVSGSSIKGAFIGSTQIEFIPKKLQERSVSKRIDIGTAGSTPLIAQTMIPIALLRGVDFHIEITGGTEVPLSPTFDYLNNVALPAYRKMGAIISLELRQRGYYPKGGGLIILDAKGSKSTLNALTFSEEAHEEDVVNILSISRELPEHVSQRQLSSAELCLKRRRGEEEGIGAVKSHVDNAGRSLSPGSSVLVWHNSDSTLVGASSLGERGKRAEDVGIEAANNFSREFKTRPNVDANLADMITTILACIPGKTRFSTSRVTEHLKTNLAVARKLTGCEFSFSQNLERRNWGVFIAGRGEKSN